MISVRFDRGLGDCANFAYQIPLYLRRGCELEIACAPDKAFLFRAAGANVVQIAKEMHGWPHAPSPGRPSHDEPWSGSQPAFNLSRPPLPEIGSFQERWKEFSEIQLTLAPFVPQECRDQVDQWLETIRGPLICLHTAGDASQGSENLVDEETKRLYRGLLDGTNATLLLLDWDNRMPHIASHRVRRLSQMPCPDLLTLYCLLQRAALLISVDSGPLHFARFTKCPAIGLWTHRFPSHYALPRRNTLHVVSREWHEWAKFRRALFQIVECPSENQLDGEWIARLAAECMPMLQDADWARLAMLRQWVGWQRSAKRGVLSEFVDRHRSSELILEALNRPNPVMVETGCIRVEEDWAGAGFSTYLFGAAIELRGGRLHSIELSPKNAAFAGLWTRDFGSTVAVHTRHSHEFLRNWSGPIDVFLSDSADVGTDGYQETCLTECRLAAPHIRPSGLLVIDDCVWNEGRWTGKGGIAVPWLLENGWKIAYSGYQTVLVRR